MDIIDAHTHVVSGDLRRYPITPGIDEEQAWHRDHPVDVEGLLALADESQVSGVALVQAISCHGFDNRYVLDSARAFPGRTIGVGAVRVDMPDAAARIADAVQLHGMHGIRAMAPSMDAPIDSEETRIAIRAAAEFGIPVVLLALARQIPTLSSLLLAFPSTTFVLDHCGFIDLTGGSEFPLAADLFALHRHENLVCKISSITLQSTPHQRELWATMVERFGAHRLLWGSDYPHTHDLGYAGLIDLALRTTEDLGTTDQASVLAGTARSIWPTFS